MPVRSFGFEFFFGYSTRIFSPRACLHFRLLDFWVYYLGIIMLDVTHVGSNWNNSVNTSTFYWNLNNSSANSNRNIATHLFYARFFKKYL